MPSQIQKFIQIQKIIQTHQEHTRAQTQKNHTNPKIKHRKSKKKKSILIYTQTKLSKRKNRFKSKN